MLMDRVTELEEKLEKLEAKMHRDAIRFSDQINALNKLGAEQLEMIAKLNDGTDILHKRIEALERSKI